ncbi:MAG TPA: PfkB family carbohydrate kinase [Acidimicrobiia bacterium]
MDAEATPSDPQARTVVVYAPGPIITVTIERGDPCEIHLHAGGQGAWVARMLANLGIDPVMCAAIGGETGDVVRDRLEHEDVTVEATPTSSWNGAYVHDRRFDERIEVARVDAPKLTRHEADDLYGNTISQAVKAGVCVLTGSEPERVGADTYGRLTTDLRANDVIVIADLAGAPLRAAAAAGVDLVKVSHEELLADGWATSADETGLLAAAGALRDAGAHDVVVSHADQPTLALLGTEALRAAGPRVDAREPRGAGDSMTAALAAAVVSELPIAEGLALAVAAGTLNATRRGLGTGERSQIEQLAHSVEITRV